MIRFVCKPYSELTLDELYDSMVLRQDVFVVEQDCPYLDADGKDKQAYHLLGYDDETLVAYARLLPKGISYDNYASIGRIVSARTVRRKGFGKQLVQASIRQCRELFPDSPIKISAQQYLLRFYENLGFVSTGDEYLEDGIPHVAMVWSEEWF